MIDPITLSVNDIGETISARQAKKIKKLAAIFG